MKKHEQIREHYSAIRNATGPVWGSGSQARVKSIQSHLDAIRELMKPEPETLVETVQRLTGICNQLGRENATLRNDLTDMTLNYNMAEKHARRLKEELASSQTYAGSLTDACNLLKKRNDQLEQNLTTAETMLHAMQQRVKSLRATCSKLMTDVEVIDLRATDVRLLRRNKELERNLCRAEARVKDLQEGIARKDQPK